MQGRFRLYVLAALFVSAPIALGWVILFLVLTTTYQYWTKSMSRDRYAMMLATALLTVVGCALSDLWCCFFGWAFVTAVLICTLFAGPLMTAPDWFTRRQQMANEPPIDYADDAIDVEWWDCSSTRTENMEQEFAVMLQKRPSDASYR